MPCSGSPATRTAPDDGLSRPAATLSSVDFPHPVGPTTDTNSPSATESVTSFTAVYGRASPARAANVQVMRSNSRAAVMPLFVFRVGLLHERVVEGLREIDLAGLLHRRLELREHLVDVLRGLHRHHPVLGEADHVLEQPLLVQRRVAGLVLRGHELDALLRGGLRDPR